MRIEAPVGRIVETQCSPKIVLEPLLERGDKHSERELKKRNLSLKKESESCKASKSRFTLEDFELDTLSPKLSVAGKGT